LIVINRIAQLFEILTHDNETLKCLLEIIKRAFHDRQQSIIPDNLLNEDSVHGFVIIGGVLFDNVFKVEHIWGLGLDALCNLIDDFLSTLSGGR